MHKFKSPYIASSITASLHSSATFMLHKELNLDSIAQEDLCQRNTLPSMFVQPPGNVKKWQFDPFYALPQQNVNQYFSRRYAD